MVIMVVGDDQKGDVDGDCYFSDHPIPTNSRQGRKESPATGTQVQSDK